MIIVASDLHLGYEKSNAAAFGRFLEQCRTIDMDHFVLLGDIMDLWRANNAQIIMDCQDVLEQIGSIEAGNCYYVPGNHDFYMYRLGERYLEGYPFRIVKKLRLKDDGGTFNFIHGHELEVLANFEPLTLESYEGISERLCFNQGILGEYAAHLWELIGNTDLLLDRIGVIRKPPGERGGMDRVRDLATSRGAFMVAGMRPGEKLVFGHTHRPFVDDTGAVANSGSWVGVSTPDRPRNTYLKIDGGRMELRIFEKDDFP